MIPSDELGMLRPAPEDCSRGAVTVTNPSFEREAAAAHKPGDRIPSSFVRRICGLDLVISFPIGFEQTKRSGDPLPRFTRRPRRDSNTRPIAPQASALIH